MSKPREYEITEAVRGSFSGEHGRVNYDLEAGIVAEGDIDREVLRRLIGAGLAVRATKRAENGDAQ
jgi:hypothetical protein